MTLQASSGVGQALLLTVVRRLSEKSEMGTTSTYRDVIRPR